MKKFRDYIMSWRPLRGRLWTKARIQLFDLVHTGSGPKTHLAIITETENTLGATIAQHAEQLATLLLLQHGFNYSEVMLIAHYEKNNNQPDSWDILTFKNASGQKVSEPLWQSATWKEIAQLIGADGSEWKSL